MPERADKTVKRDRMRKCEKGGCDEEERGNVAMFVVLSFKALPVIKRENFPFR